MTPEQAIAEFKHDLILDDEVVVQNSDEHPEQFWLKIKLPITIGCRTDDQPGSCRDSLSRLFSDLAFVLEEREKEFDRQLAAEKAGQ